VGTSLKGYSKTLHFKLYEPGTRKNIPFYVALGPRPVSRKTGARCPTLVSLSRVHGWPRGAFRQFSKTSKIWMKPQKNLQSPQEAGGVKRMPKSSDGVLPPQTFAKGHKKETDDPRLTVPAPERTGASSPFSRRLFARGCPDPALTVAKSESAYSPTIIFGDGDALPDGGRPTTASAQA
jgi:hypothetical protein